MFGKSGGDRRELVLEEDPQGLVTNSDVAEAGQLAWLYS